MPHARRLLPLVLLCVLSALAETGELAPELRQLGTLEACYRQEKDSFSRDPAEVGMPSAPGQGFLVDSLAPAFWTGLAWRDGMLRAVRLDLYSFFVGPSGWEDTAAIPSLRQILSNPSGTPAQDTLVSGMRLHLWSRTSGDTLWNLALDTTCLNVFALRRIGTRWSALGLDTLPRDPAAGVRSSRHAVPVRTPLRTDLLGRPREGARLGTTTLRPPR